MLIYYRDSKSVISIYIDILTGNCKYTCMYIYIYLLYVNIYSIYIKNITASYSISNNISKFDRGTAQRSTSGAGDLGRQLFFGEIGRLPWHTECRKSAWAGI